MIWAGLIFFAGAVFFSNGPITFAGTAYELEKPHSPAA